MRRLERKASGEVPGAGAMGRPERPRKMSGVREAEGMGDLLHQLPLREQVSRLAHAKFSQPVRRRRFKS